MVKSVNISDSGIHPFQGPPPVSPKPRRRGEPRHDVTNTPHSNENANSKFKVQTFKSRPVESISELFCKMTVSGRDLDYI